MNDRGSKCSREQLALLRQLRVCTNTAPPHVSADECNQSFSWIPIAVALQVR